MTAPTKLIEANVTCLFHGNILRVPGRYPYEDIVDFMLYETQSEDRPYGLIVASGYKAGLILVQLPTESHCVDGGVAVPWMVSNWNTWIYPECDVSDVYLIDRYEALRIIQ